MFGKMKLDPADKAFSMFIRLRDRQCMRCYSPVSFNAKGLPVTHQASHFFGRARESTRFDESNVDTLCGACHRIWGSDDREGYRVFKIKQLGQQGYDLLQLRANTVDKSIDRKMIAMYYRQELRKMGVKI